MSAPTRVVLADDQELIRVGLERIFGAEPDLMVVASCGDGIDALDAVEEHSPDLIVMDVRMPRLDGIAAIRRLRAGAGPTATTPVLVLTTFGEDEALWGAIDAGTTGFVLKDVAADELLRATRAVARGGAWLDPSVTPRVLDLYRSLVLPTTRRQALVRQLSEREHDVLALMATGASNGEIAESLFVSMATVKSHVGSIFTKLDVRDRAGAIVYAFQHGIVPPAGGPPESPTGR